MPAVRWSLAGSRGLGDPDLRARGAIRQALPSSPGRWYGSPRQVALPGSLVGMDDGWAAAQTHIESLPEPRRSQVQHLHDVITSAIPEADVSMWEYGGTLIGYGSYEYSDSRGRPTGRWFSLGLANRKGYISLFSMGQRAGGYLVEAVHDRFPGTKIGRSCLNITNPEAIDDDAVRDLARETWDQYKDGFRRPTRSRRA